MKHTASFNVVILATNFNRITDWKKKEENFCSHIYSLISVIFVRTCRLKVPGPNFTLKLQICDRNNTEISKKYLANIFSYRFAYFAMTLIISGVRQVLIILTKLRTTWSGNYKIVLTLTCYTSCFLFSHKPRHPIIMQLRENKRLNKLETCGQRLRESTTKLPLMRWRNRFIIVALNIIIVRYLLLNT